MRQVDPNGLKPGATFGLGRVYDESVWDTLEFIVETAIVEESLSSNKEDVRLTFKAIKRNGKQIKGRVASDLGCPTHCRGSEYAFFVPLSKKVETLICFISPKSKVSWHDNNNAEQCHSSK